MWLQKICYICFDQESPLLKDIFKENGLNHGGLSLASQVYLTFQKYF